MSTESKSMTPEEKAAREAMGKKSKAYVEAKEELNEAEAKVLRTVLGQMFADHPEVTHFSWEHESVYDDEGSYDDVANIEVHLGDNVPDGVDPDELMDELRDELWEFSCEAWAIVCGDGQYEGAVDRDSLEADA